MSMNNLEYLALVSALPHFVMATIFIRDLFTVSKRENKMLWLFFLLVVPFVSAYAYRVSMKRKRRYLFH